MNFSQNVLHNIKEIKVILSVKPVKKEGPPFSDSYFKHSASIVIFIVESL